jgi:arylsulfatase A-like enzyme
MKGLRCGKPMDSVDIYPTLLDLCDIDAPNDLDGISFKKLLADPAADWKPAVMMLQRHNVAVRSERFRYIRYEDGTEELYNHEEDPGEHNNLASHPELAPVITKLSSHIPKDWVVNGLPFPFHKGYTPPLVRTEFEETKAERQASWVAPARYEETKK